MKNLLLIVLFIWVSNPISAKKGLIHEPNGIIGSIENATLHWYFHSKDTLYLLHFKNAEPKSKEDYGYIIWKTTGKQVVYEELLTLLKGKDGFTDIFLENEKPHIHIIKFKDHISIFDEDSKSLTLNVDELKQLFGMGIPSKETNSEISK